MPLSKKIINLTSFKCSLIIKLKKGWFMIKALLNICHNLTLLPFRNFIIQTDTLTRFDVLYKLEN